MKTTIEYRCPKCGIPTRFDDADLPRHVIDENGTYIVCLGSDARPQRVAVVPVYMTEERLPDDEAVYQSDCGPVSYERGLKQWFELESGRICKSKWWAPMIEIKEQTKRGEE